MGSQDSFRPKTTRITFWGEGAAMDFRYTCQLTKKDGTPVHIFTGTVFHDTAEAAAKHLTDYYGKLWPHLRVRVEIFNA